MMEKQIADYKNSTAQLLAALKAGGMGDRFLTRMQGKADKWLEGVIAFAKAGHAGDMGEVLEKQARAAAVPDRVEEILGRLEALTKLDQIAEALKTLAVLYDNLKSQADRIKGPVDTPEEQAAVMEIDRLLDEHIADTAKEMKKSMWKRLARLVFDPEDMR